MPYKRLEHQKKQANKKKNLQRNNQSFRSEVEEAVRYKQNQASMAGYPLHLQAEILQIWAYRIGWTNIIWTNSYNPILLLVLIFIWIFLNNEKKYKVTVVLFFKAGLLNLCRTAATDGLKWPFEELLLALQRWLNFSAPSGAAWTSQKYSFL